MIKTIQYLEIAEYLYKTGNQVFPDLNLSHLQTFQVL